MAQNAFMTISNAQTGSDLTFSDADLIAQRYSVPVQARANYHN